MIRNCEKRYYKDEIREMNAMEKAGLDTDGTSVDEKIQKTSTLRLGIGKYKHIKSNLMCCATGAFAAILIKIVKSDDSVEVAIVTDMFYDMMIKDAKNYILTHEDGHIFHGHGGSDDKAREAVLSGESMNLDNRDIEKEYAADEYAARQNGKEATLKAMNEYLQIMEKNAWTEFDTDELIQRMEHLKETKI